MQTSQQKIGDGFAEALGNVVNGLMEAGSHLKLILCIFRNCTLITHPRITSAKKLDFLSSCAGFPENIPEITGQMLAGAEKTSESWFMSCFVDLMDMFAIFMCLMTTTTTIAVASDDDYDFHSEAGEESHIDFSDCFKVFLDCLKFPNDKQHKLRISTLKAMQALVDISPPPPPPFRQFNHQQSPELYTTAVIDKDSFNELIGLKLITKLPHMQSTVYYIMTRILQQSIIRQYSAQSPSPQLLSSKNSFPMVKDFVDCLIHGVGKPLLEILIKDINQYKNVESVLTLVNTLINHNQQFLLYLTKKITTNLSTLLTSASGNASKEQVLQFLLFVRKTALSPGDLNSR